MDRVESSELPRVRRDQKGHPRRRLLKPSRPAPPSRATSTVHHSLNLLRPPLAEPRQRPPLHHAQTSCAEQDAFALSQLHRTLHRDPHHRASICLAPSSCRVSREGDGRFGILSSAPNDLTLRYLPSTTVPSRTFLRTLHASIGHALNPLVALLLSTPIHARQDTLRGRCSIIRQSCLRPEVPTSAHILLN